MSAFSVRLASEADLAGLLDLYAGIRADQPAIERSEEIEQIWRSMLADPALSVAVIERGDQLLATAMLAVVPSIAKGPAPFGIIEHVVTAAAARRQGMGEAVMRFVIDRAWAAGCYKVMLLSGAQRDGAHRLYEQLGFDGGIERGFALKRPTPT